jgi:hypothetical protein
MIATFSVCKSMLRTLLNSHGRSTQRLIKKPNFYSNFFDIARNQSLVSQKTGEDCC